MLAAVQETKREVHDTDYDVKLEKAQKAWKLRPVVWNKGHTIGAPPMSKLSLKIGLQDIDTDDEEIMTPAAGKL